MVTLIDRLTHSGGAERIAATLTAELDPERFERTICVSRSARELPRRKAEAAGVRVIALDRRHRLSIWKWWPLIALLRRERIDVLHAHQFGSNLWGSVIGRLAGVPVVVAHEHTWSFEGQPVRRFLDRAVIGRAADVILAVSREDERRLVEVEGVKPDVVRFLPNGIAPLTPPSGRDVRAELGIPATAPVVLTVSVLRRQKALEVLVEAAGVLARELPGLKVLIAGAGPERETLEAEVRRRGLESVVSFLGMRRDVSDLLAASDVAVSSSDYEGSPLAVMEYMAAGKAIVATRVGGVPDLVEEGVNGLLVERRDPPALAAAMGRLLRDPGLRAAMGERGRERQRSEFSLDAMAARVGDLYEELLGSGGRKASVTCSRYPADQ